MIAALALGTTEHQQLPLADYWQSPNWYISKTSRDCTAATSPAKGVMFLLFVIPEHKGISVFYDNPALNIENQKIYSMRAEFSHNGEHRKSWPEQPAQASLSEGKVPGFGWPIKGYGALDDIAASEEMTLVADGQIVGKVGLAGSTDMVVALKRCVAELETGLRPSSSKISTPR
ncbi:MAG: hypothetical protein J7499_10380 [Sphingopyxis sp.]|nr:hypothetical protein [Sphingopyxis sp.]